MILTLSLLYTVMMSTSQAVLASTLDCIAQEASQGEESSGGGGGGTILFHCQKGKDRSGVLAMLLQSVLGESNKDILDAYVLSEALLGEGDGVSSTRSTTSNGSGGGGGLVDWSKLRGSPPTAMEETLSWTKQEYGSVHNYLMQDCRQTQSSSLQGDEKVC